MIQFNRRGHATLLAASVVGFTVLGAAGPAAQREPRERHALVAVTDKSDKPVPGLTVQDFTVREDNMTREVVSVEPAAPPSHIVLLVDDSQAIQPLLVDLRSGLKTFLRQMLGNEQRSAIRLATFGDRPTTLAEFTTSLPPLTTAVDRLMARPGAGGVLLEAIFENCRDLKKQAATHPVIVAFVEEHGPEFSNETHERIEAALKEVGASLWTVVLQDQTLGGQDRSQEIRERTRVLTETTVASGGKNTTFLSRQGIEPAFVDVANKLNNRYDIMYMRPGSFNAPARLDVQVRNRELRLTAPRWPMP